jgi:tetratricopeptide (TPR) repeat protein
MLMKRIVTMVWLVLAGLTLTLAQIPAEVELADRYFQDGEFESALELYQKLNRRNSEEKFVLRIVECYELLTRYDEALEFMTKTLRRTKNPSVLYPLIQAGLYEKTGQLKESDEVYQETISKKLRSQGDFVQAGSFLFQAGKLELARQAYEQARKRLRDNYIFANEIANIYMQLGEYEPATNEYLNVYFANTADLSAANLAILNMVNPYSAEAVERALLAASDKYETDLGLRSILYEFYVLAENFYEAFVQVKAIDRLFKEDGGRVFRFAETMRNNQNYALSNQAFDYIIERKKNSPYFQQAFMEKAINGELQAFDQIPVDMVAVTQAVMVYGDLLDEFGRRPQYFDAIYRRARLQVFYLNQLSEARSELEKISAQRNNLSLEDWAKAKLLIGDIQLIQQEYNEAKLTYTEVSEIFRDRQLGALSKYKLGQLAYYKGEFNLSQALLGAIKDNTSNDISNDAIKLNLLIIDNTGLDTTTTALEMFAQAQLLAYQRQYEASEALLDSLAYQFPTHTLADEILWEKANIYLRQNDINTAQRYIDRILTEFPYDIYGDDALYTKARIFDYTLKDTEQAMELYLDFLTRYPGSLYSVEVRKRIRELRKDGS